MSTIVFVHGTGVRHKDYSRTFQTACEVASQCRIDATFIPCAWGDPLGVEFPRLSLPGAPNPAQLEDEAKDFARWNWLFDDPLFELDKLTIRASIPAPPASPGVMPEWEQTWRQVATYQPSLELNLLLQRSGLHELWPDAWAAIVQRTSLPRNAFEASAHELAEATHALARALIAQLHVDAVAAGIPGPNRTARDKLFAQLIGDWNQQVLGIGAFFANILKRVATSVLSEHRNRLSNAISLPIGDILLYQARGHEVREFIRAKIASAAPPVTLVAHSLGGIACVDLLALMDAPKVSHLVTVGSQAPLLYEIGALYSLKAPHPLPPHFPPWLNLYDRNDFLSYVAHRLWPQVVDAEIASGQPFPDSHGAYFGNEATWRAIRDFMIR